MKAILSQEEPSAWGNIVCKRYAWWQSDKSVRSSETGIKDNLCCQKFTEGESRDFWLWENNVGFVRCQRGKSRKAILESRVSGLPVFMYQPCTSLHLFIERWISWTFCTSVSYKNLKMIASVVIERIKSVNVISYNLLASFKKYFSIKVFKIREINVI